MPEIIYQDHEYKVIHRFGYELWYKDVLLMLVADCVEIMAYIEDRHQP